MAGKHTQGKAKPSGWDRYDAVMNAGGAALVLLVLAVGAVLLGLACIRWGMGDANTWKDRPQEVVKAELIETSSRRSTDSSSDWFYAGRYAWSYQGSSGSFWDDHEYEQEGLVPSTRRVHIYLETDDTWHQMGAHGEGVASSGALTLGGVALLVGGLAVGLFSAATLRGKLAERLSPGKDRPHVESASTNPMARFACEACDAFLADASEEAASFKSTKKILRGLGIPRDQEVYLIHDATLFKSGKDGFAITERGFSCRNMGEQEAHTVSWAELARAEQPRLDDTHVRAGSLDLVYFSGESGNGPSPKLVALCQELWKQAQKMAR